MGRSPAASIHTRSDGWRRWITLDVALRMKARGRRRVGEETSELSSNRSEGRTGKMQRKHFHLYNSSRLAAGLK